MYNIMSSCYKTSDNKYFDCPPKMSDGRHFTDYRQNCMVNNLVRVNNNQKNSQEFREFLTNNAVKLMHINKKYICDKNCSSSCHTNVMIPEKRRQSCNSMTCETTVDNKNGVGTGRTYGNKWNDNLSFPTEGPKTCCAQPADNHNYYSLLPDFEKKIRSSMPGGGNILSGGDINAYKK